MNRRKAIIIGGSRGIGLAVAKNLVAAGVPVYCLSRTSPPRTVFSESENSLLKHVFFDLSKCTPTILTTLLSDRDFNFLLFSAGIGRLSKWGDNSIKEIETTFLVNAVSPIQLLTLASSRLQTHEKFYCGFITSIAGAVSSPLFSLYAATKAAVFRYIESVNIELEQLGFNNRITNIAPGHISGTSFEGGSTRLFDLQPLAKDIIDKISQSTPLYIPNSGIYQNVLKRYHEDPHQFGISSYQYKMSSRRMN